MPKRNDHEIQTGFYGIRPKEIHFMPHRAATIIEDKVDHHHFTKITVLLPNDQVISLNDLVSHYMAHKS